MHRPLLLSALGLVGLLLVLPAPGRAQEAALEGLRGAARSAPRDYDAQVALGRALLEAGRYRDASTTLRRAAGLRRGDPAPLYEIARVDFAQREHRRARAQCRAIERAAAGSALSHVCQARAFLAWNRSARAFEEVEAALAQSPDDYEALLALGDAHRLRASVREAAEAYGRAIRVSPTAAEPHLGLGQLYAAAHDTPAALRELRLAHELDGDDPDVDFELGRALAETPDGAAQGLVHLREAVGNRAGWTLARASLGDALLALGQHEEAIRELRTVLREDPRLPQARAALGRALIAAGELEEAESTLTQAIEQVPNDAVSVSALAEVYARTERAEEAYEQYRHAADLDPTSPQPLLAAARLALSQQRPVLAVGFLSRVLSAHPNDAAALALMGDVMRARSQATQARDFYRRALSADGPIDRAAVEAALRALP